ncbi:actin-related protein 2 3 complex subunit 4 [Cryptosporidium andersoni]|uniref:Actin-related protein 2 3 complex subunit 4 n=1 Tax=Cryptosporidium andersoni TaxID=117008 RepID=A0A1J4MQU3_9CRYT|nr:actin-related protein 2 3 complex subunit 4 [Cryptosporidium andersoni]
MVLLEDVDAGSPLMPYLRRIFKALNKELCLYYSPLYFPSAFSIPSIEDNPGNYNSLTKSLYIYRHSKEYCLIESCLDSVRISLKFYLMCKFEQCLFQQAIKFMTKNSDYFKIIRKKEILGFDVSFLISYNMFENLHYPLISPGKYDAINFVLKFIVSIDMQIQKERLQSTYFSRSFAYLLVSSLNVEDFEYGNNIKIIEQEVMSKKKNRVKSKNCNSECFSSIVNEYSTVTHQINAKSIEEGTPNNSLLNDSLSKDSVILKALRTRFRMKNLQ